jgi:hypothetical protein
MAWSASLIAFVVPAPTGPCSTASPAWPARPGPTLRHPDLLRLDLGIFVLHAILMASFVALPLARRTRRAAQGAALVGLPDRAADFFFAMIPFIIYGEKKRKMKRVLLGAVSVLLLVSYSSGSSADSLRDW